jgi:hypothetical protein
VESTERQAIASTLLGLTSRFDGEKLTASLDEFGWEELHRAEPVVAVAVLFQAQGRSGSWSSALHDLLGSTSRLGDHDLGGATVLIPRPHSDVSMNVHRGVGTVDGLLVGARSSTGPVVATAGVGAEMQIVRIARQFITIEEVRGLDGGLKVQRVSGDLNGGELLADGAVALQWWSTAVAAARRAIAFGLCGAMESMLDQAVSHANERQQFGRPVGAFQAVRHRLASCRVLITGATAAAGAALPCEEPELAALAAKVVAGRAQQSVGTHCQQVLAGMGFTADHPFHAFLFRAIVLDRLFGSASELAPEVGRALIRRGGAPRLVEL